ncbi:MAG: sigma-70 family RNA polymerase sigma factor [Opitutaceae bacterium]
MRNEQRRRKHEQAIQTVTEVLGSGDLTDDAAWERLRPLLDDAMDKLSDDDREALLLRFCEGRPLGEIGRRLSVSDNTARMRVERALEKLRTLLARRGITSTSAALSTVLASNVVNAAPAGLATAAASAAMIGSLAAATPISSLIYFMSTSKIVTGAAVLIAALAIGTAFHEYRTRREGAAALARALQDQAGLQSKAAEWQQLAGRAPPAVVQTAPTGTGGDADFQGLVAQLRAAGYSEDLVRNVVGDVVSQHFKARRRALGLEPGRDRVEFWKSPVSADTPERIAGRRVLEQEQDEALRSLFGSDYSVSEDARRQRAHGLPEETATKLHRIFADYRDLEEEGKTSPEARVRLGTLAKEKRADIERLLTPEQMLEFDLRMGAGEALHSRLGSTFQIAEPEFRALYQAQKAFNDANPALSGRDRNAQFEPEIRRVLGETRYAELLAASQKSAQPK